MTQRNDIWTVADALQMDLRAAQSKLVELRAQLSALNLPPSRERTSFPNGPVTAEHCEFCGCAPPLHAADCPTLVPPDLATETDADEQVATLEEAG